MKKNETNDPVEIIYGGLEKLATWAPFLIVLAVLGFLGTVGFALLWWFG